MGEAATGGGDEARGVGLRLTQAQLTKGHSDEDEEAIEAAAESHPTRTAIERLLRPRSVAIVGASPTPSSFGASVLANLENAGFAGDLYLINPKRSEIHGRPYLPSIDALPHGVDCAVLAIPRASVLESVAACGRCGVCGVIIFSAGFAESGAEGRAEQEKLAAIAHDHGMLIEGPNCLGMVNFIDGVPLTFVLTPPSFYKGSEGIAIASQSGAMAAVVGVGLRSRELGISFSISTGNEAVSNVEDYVDYLVEEEHTRALLMIVEHFRHPRRFLAAAERARSMGKHIVLLHPGRSRAARTSAETHTGAMAGDYQVMRTKVLHGGVVVVDTLEELLDVTEILIRCPSPPSGGAAVFTESGAFKALTLDFCDALGLPLPPLSDATSAALRRVLPDFIPPTNPLDLTAQALVDPELYGRTLPIVLNDDNYGSLVLGIILTDEATSDLKFPPIIETVRRLKPTKPVLFAGLDEGAHISPAYVSELRGLGVPFFPSPERAYRALGSLTSFAEQQSRGKSIAAELDQLPALSTGVIPEYRSKDVLRSVGVPIPQGNLARTAEQAYAIAGAIGYPVVLKAQSELLSHKSDVGGVALNLSTAEAVTAAWKRMHEEIGGARPGLVLDGVLVEKMGARGVELIVGAQRDPEWGPVLLVGSGGILAEALHDVRLLPPDLSVEAIESELLQAEERRAPARLSRFAGPRRSCRRRDCPSTGKPDARCAADPRSGHQPGRRLSARPGSGRARRADCDRMTSATSSMQIQAQVAGRRRQVRQKTAPHLLERHSLRLRSDIHRGHDLAVSAGDRHGERSQTLLQLLVDHGEALVAHFAKQLAQPGRGDDRPRSVTLQLDAPQVVLQVLRRKMSQQDASHRCAVKRKTAADGEVHGHDPGNVGAGNIQQFVSVERGHGAGLLQGATEFFEQRLGSCRQPARRGVGVAQRQDPWGQREIFGVLLADKAQQLQRMQASPDGSAGKAGLHAYMRDSHSRGSTGERLDHGEAAGQRVHEIRIAGGRRGQCSAVIFGVWLRRVGRMLQRHRGNLRG